MREKHGLQFIHNSKGSDYIAGVVAATKGFNNRSEGNSREASALSWEKTAFGSIETLSTKKKKSPDEPRLIGGFPREHSHQFGDISGRPPSHKHLRSAPPKFSPPSGAVSPLVST
jgi:hypothetical protein